MTLLKSTILLLTITFLSNTVLGTTTHKQLYHSAFQEQHQMLTGEIPFDFSRAVFITENSYHNGKLNYLDFKKEIEETGIKIKKFIVESEMTTYKTAVNWAVFTYMTEGLKINNNQPYSYDFNDYFGEKDFTKMFVTKLMGEKSGNCHSMPYLYKIICDELGAKSHLAITPNHVYIKHINEKGRWANVELTNASFPKDKWIIKDFVIPEKALKNKLYMQPLSDNETIAVTLFDLANAYEVQFGVDSFYLSIVDTALSYFPNSISLLMNKANYYTALGNNELKNEFPNLEYLAVLHQKEALIDQKISDLGHKGMSKKMYAKMVRMMDKQMKKNKKKQKKIQEKITSNKIEKENRNQLKI
ncbi:MAG: hypothetical protein ACJA0Q_001682 [Saprospiraceae bacterium]|jgi:hypothetical protein